MISALRRTRLAWVFAAVALFATMPVTVSSLLHDDSDDAICNAALVVHDHTGHHLGTEGSALPDPQHCVLCHTLLSLRAVATAIRFAPPPDDARLVALAATPCVSSIVVSGRPARAPPLA